MNSKLKLFFFISIIAIFLTLTPRKTLAVEPIFQDNFNDGNADGWFTPFNECGNGVEWKVENNQYGILLNVGGCQLASIPGFNIINVNEDYQIELDIFFPESTHMDRNFIYKFQDRQNWYGFHFIDNHLYNTIFINGLKAASYHTTYPFSADTTYSLKINVYSDRADLYINNVYITTYPEVNPALPNNTFALWASAGTIGHSEVWFDNIKVTSLSATPTPTPSILDVVDYKQYSNPWGVQEYDHANSWWSADPTITRWGCAITSASMVLNYNGHDSTTPESLNNWLKTQPDGYTRNGAVIWNALSRYSILHPEGSTLEFSYHLPSFNLISDMLNTNIPPIIKHKANGNIHLLVAKGQDNNDFIINDPASTKTNLSDAENYWGGVYRVGKFEPTSTDLSAISLYVDKNFKIKVSSESGEITDDEHYFEEGPYADPTDPNADTGLEILNAFNLPKPANKNYSVEIIGSGAYQLDTYLYDQNGEVIMESLHGEIEQGENSASYFLIVTNNFQLIFPNDPTEGFNNLLDTWEKGYKESLVTKDKTYYSTTSLIKLSQRQFKKNHPKISKFFLRLGWAIIRKSTPRFIDQDFSNLMQEKINLQLGNY